MVSMDFGEDLVSNTLGEKKWKKVWNCKRASNLCVFEALLIFLIFFSTIIYSIDLITGVRCVRGYVYIFRSDFKCKRVTTCRSVVAVPKDRLHRQGQAGSCCLLCTGRVQQGSPPDNGHHEGDGYRGVGDGTGVHVQARFPQGPKFHREEWARSKEKTQDEADCAEERACVRDQLHPWSILNFVKTSPINSLLYFILMIF